jgi:hypothetical protein
MGLLVVVPLAAAMAAMALQIGGFAGCFLASLATVLTSLAAVVGLVMLL